MFRYHTTGKCTSNNNSSHDLVNWIMQNNNYCNWWGALYQEGWSEKQFRQKSAETIKAEKCVLNKMKPMRMLLLPCHNFAKWGKTTTLSDWSKKCVQWKMSLEISLFSYCITMVLVLLDTGCRRYSVHFETNRSVFFWKTDRKIGSWV